MSNPKIEKRWISKYALKSGVYCISVAYDAGPYGQEYKPGFVSERSEGQPVVHGFHDRAGKYDFATAEEAVAHAETLRAEEIAKLEKKLEALREMKAIHVHSDRG